MAQRLAVVILHYGKTELTSRLFRQLRESDPDWKDLFVLDNNAPEPFAESWVRLDENRYWAGALSYAVQRLQEEGYSHLWFLNNDIYFSIKAPIILKAWKRLQHIEKKVGSVGIYSPSALANPYHPQMVHDPRYQFRQACYVDGIAPLFNLACIEELGGIKFSGNEYGYGVDVALSLAAHDAGWPVIIDHQVSLKHVYHSTARKIDGFLEKAAIAEDAYMRQILGPDWRDVLNRVKTVYTDYSRM